VYNLNYVPTNLEVPSSGEITSVGTQKKKKLNITALRDRTE
jgi:hypothetical protein